MKRIGLISVAVVAMLPFATVAQTSSSEVPLAQASLVIEINATDGDAGIQPFMDADPWQRAVVYGPDGQRLFDVRTHGELRDYGLTELFSESSEPPFSRFSLERFKELFPEGEYRFEATAVDGALMVGFATLSHEFPAAPSITSPEAGASVPDDGAVVSWEPGTEGSDIEIVGYQVVIEQEAPVLRTFAVDVPADVLAVPTPAGFLQAGDRYKVEVMAIATNGNRTLSEVSFSTD